MPDTARIVVSVGDPAGIGSLLIEPLLERVTDRVRLVFVGPESVRTFLPWEWEDDPLSVNHQWEDSGSIPSEEIQSGSLSVRSGQAAFHSLRRAVEILRSGNGDGLLTLPLSKEAVRSAGYDDFRGHTDYLETVWGRRAVMTFLGETVNVALLTRHIPLREVPDRIEPQFVKKQIRTVAEFYKRREWESPKFALLGLNPHAGEGGLLGQIEETVLKPAVESLRKEGISISGPYASDSYFPTKSSQHDLVFACYHDQGLIPFKIHSFYTGVHATLGLPVPRVSPDHGVAADVASSGDVDPRSAVRSLRMLSGWLLSSQPKEEHPEAQH